MVLSTHIVIARAITKPLAAGSPILGFFVSWASHYLSDLVPHWDYRLDSLIDEDPKTRAKKLRTRDALGDYIKVAFDALFGAVVAYLMVVPQTAHDWIYLGAVILGSVFPDFIQFLYYLTNWKFLKLFQDFQELLHTKIKLGPKPLIGIPFQAAIFLLAVFLTL